MKGQSRASRRLEQEIIGLPADFGLAKEHNIDQWKMAPLIRGWSILTKIARIHKTEAGSPEDISLG